MTVTPRSTVTSSSHRGLVVLSTVADWYKATGWRGGGKWGLNALGPGLGLESGLELALGLTAPEPGLVLRGGEAGLGCLWRGRERLW